MKREPGNPHAISRRQFLENAALISALAAIPQLAMGCKRPAHTNLGFIGTGKQALDLKKFFFRYR